MKLIVAIIKPYKLEEVRDALAATVHGATASDDWRATVARR